MIFSVDRDTITAYGYIWEGDGMDFIETITGALRQNENITIRLHSYGGSVFDGNLIMNALRENQSKIKLQIIGVAASMGAMISTAVKNVQMVRNGFMMIHAPSGYTAGDADKHESTATLLRSMEKTFRADLMQKTGKNEDEVGEWLNGDNWFDAEAALAAGLITGIIDSVADIDIDETEPEELGPEGMYNKYAAVLMPSQSSNQLQFIQMKKAIINALGLTGVNEQSSDTAIVDAVQEHYEAQEKQLQKELNESKTKLASLESAQKAETDKAVSALITKAKAEGKITGKQEDTLRKVADTSGVQALSDLLETIPGRKPITGAVKGAVNATSSDRVSWDYDQWQKEDPRGMEAKAQEDPEWFQSLLDKKFKSK